MGEGRTKSLRAEFVGWKAALAFLGGLAAFVTPERSGAARAMDRAPRSAGAVAESRVSRSARKVPGLSNYSLQRPEADQPIAAAAARLSVSVVLGDRVRTLHLRPDSLRAPGFAVYVAGGDGVLTETQPPPSSLVRGTVDEDPATRVVGSRSEKGLSLRIALSTDEVWILQPASDLGVTANEGVHAVYRDVDVQHEAEGCAAGDDIHRAMKQVASGSAFGVTAAEPAVGAILKVAEVAFDVDHEYFALNNSSVAATVADVEDILARVTQIYEAEAGITYELTAVVIRTVEPDPYSAGDATSLLSQFASEWNANMRPIPRDTAHLLTGRVLSNGVIGTANIDVICDVCGNADGYGLSRSRYSNVIEARTCVTAHELGHNWGAQHCDASPDCGIMCSQIGGCSADCVHFGSVPRSVIEASRDDAPCLGSVSGPLDAPFCDDFNGAMNSIKWTYNNVATISGGAVSLPSPPTALLLNNCCSGCDGTPWPDDVRSNFIRLGELSSATLAYHTEFRGGPATAGSQLVVEYLGANGLWAELNRITANGTNQIAFAAWVHPLPEDARHDRFRLRFHLDGSTPHADWYIDDVTVSQIDSDSPVLYVNAAAAPGGTGESWATAFRDLRDALGAAECSFGLVTEIWVAAGTYKPDRGTGDRDATFALLDGVSVYGGFRGSELRREDRDPRANVTILSGEIGNLNSRLDNTFHVVTAGGTGPATHLDGFTITRGQADGALAPDDAGGGLINASGAPTITNCVFVENRARRGGAMHHSLGAAPTVQESIFHTNFTLTDSGGAISAELGSYVNIERCRFLANVSQDGGGAIDLSESSAEIRNSLFAVNAARVGGAIHTSNAGASLTNSTLAGNFAATDGGGIADDAGAVSLRNCVLWNNTDAEGSGQSSQLFAVEPMVEYSLVQGLTGSWGGVGNLASNPLFFDPDGADNAVGTLDDDFRPRSNSPAIDAGDPNFAAALNAADLDGFPRVLRGRVDIGAFEFGMADFDQDRITERSDAVVFATCLTGPGLGYAAPCRVFDFDADADLDLRDFARLARYLSQLPPHP